MANFSSDFAAYVVAQGKATALGTDVFLEGMPPTPDKCLAITDTGGPKPVEGATAIERHLQLRFRSSHEQAAGSGSPEAHDWAWQVFGLFQLEEGRTITVNGRTYTPVPMQLPFPMGPDETGRPQWVFNLSVIGPKE
jgi:hypothetical protein